MLMGFNSQVPGRLPPGFKAKTGRKGHKREQNGAERQETPVLTTLRTLGYSPRDELFLLKTVHKAEKFMKE